MGSFVDVFGFQKPFNFRKEKEWGWNTRFLKSKKEKMSSEKKKKNSKFVSLQEEACIESWTMLLRSSSPLVSLTNSKKKEKVFLLD